jgi:hypothetical protein
VTPGEKEAAGVYCLKVPGTLHNGVATSDVNGGGAVPSVDSVSLEPKADIESEACGAETTVVVHTFNSTGEPAAAGFFININ